MGNALHVVFANSTATASFSSLGGGSSTGTPEANTQSSFRQAGTFSRLGFKNIGGSGTNTNTLRVAGAGGNNTTSKAGTGWSEDTTHTDVISANTLMGITYTDTGTNPTYTPTKVLFNASGDHCCYYIATAVAGVVCDVGSSTRYNGFGGTLVADFTAAASIANVQFKSRATGTLRSFQVRVTANARTTTSDFKTNIGGSAGNGLCSFATLATGLVIDDTHIDTLADGTLYCAELTLPDAGVEDLTVTIVAAAVTHASAFKSDLFAHVSAGAARTASATPNYPPIGGQLFLTATVEANSSLQPGFDGSISNVGANVSANTYTGSATIKVFRNAAAVLTLTIGAGALGWVENLTDSISFAAGDTLSYEIVGGTANSITLRAIRMTVEDYVLLPQSVM